MKSTEEFFITVLTFDTLKYANKLKAANVPSEQAEATVEIMSEAFEINLKDLATKEDLHREINLLEERVISKMTLRLGSMLVVTVGLIFTLIKLFGI